ncbi:MAG: hypothetical protein PHQ70_12430, partial [Arcobacter sp.]|uniref:hypothetical protein n=1 Tax=Arcobacter sp. TaxID=1872629 RepID=UPI00258DDE28
FDVISDYLPQIYDLISSRFFTITTTFQIYLEESENSYAIRVSISENEERNLGIYDKKTQPSNFQKQFYFSPKYFANNCGFFHKNKFSDNAQKYELEKVIRLQKIYSFDDKSCFLPFKTFTCVLELSPKKDSFLSPLIFPQSHNIPDIPTLANILAHPKYKKKKYNPPKYSSHANSRIKLGITPFTIPTFFKFNFTFKSYLRTFYFFDQYKTVFSQNLFDFVLLHNAPLAKSRISTDPIYMSTKSISSKLAVSGAFSHNLLSFNSDYLSDDPYIFGSLKMPFTSNVKLPEAGSLKFIIPPQDDDPRIKKEVTVFSLVLSKADFSYKKAILNFVKNENLAPIPELENSFLIDGLNVTDYVTDYYHEKELFSFKIFCSKAQVKLPKNLVLRRTSLITKSVLFENNRLPEAIPPDKKLFISSLNAGNFLRESGSFATFKTSFNKSLVILSSEFRDVSYDFINYKNSMLPICINFKISSLKVDYSLTNNKAGRYFPLTYKTLFKTQYIDKDNKKESYSSLINSIKRKTIDFSISLELQKPTSGLFSNESYYKDNSKQQYKPILIKDKSYLNRSSLFDMEESIPLLKNSKESERIKICPKGMLGIIPTISTYSSINMILKNKELREILQDTPKTIGFADIVSSDLTLIIPKFQPLTTSKQFEPLVSNCASYLITTSYLIKKPIVKFPEIPGLKVEPPQLNYVFKKLLNKSRIWNLFLHQKPKINISTYYFSLEKKKILTEMHLHFADLNRPCALRKLTPRISQIKYADKSHLDISRGIFDVISSINFNLENLKPPTSYSKNLTFRTAYSESDIACFQVPLLVKSLKMNNSKPVFQATNPNLFENLHSTIIVNLHSKLRHINFSYNKKVLERSASVSPVSFSHKKVFPAFNSLNFSDKFIIKRLNLYQSYKRENYEINKIKPKDILLWAQNTAKRLKTVNQSVEK